MSNKNHLPTEIIEEIMSFCGYSTNLKICTLSKEQKSSKDIVTKQIYEEYEKLKLELYTCKLYLNLCASLNSLYPEYCMYCFCSIIHLSEYGEELNNESVSHCCHVSDKDRHESKKNVRLYLRLEEYLQKNKKDMENILENIFTEEAFSFNLFISLL